MYDEGCEKMDEKKIALLAWKFFLVAVLVWLLASFTDLGGTIKSLWGSL